MTATAQHRDAGADRRRHLSRTAQGELHLPADRDPVAIIESQHASRLQELVPVRVGRMLQSPFAYYRGTAAVMAADLAGAPSTGIDVVSCGDAHVSNFGFFASPERDLIFDLNDFDEGAVGPWEWDGRRMAGSVHVGGRHIGMSESACVAATTGAVRGYREGLAEMVGLSAVERYFTRADESDVETFLGTVGAKAARKARRRTSEQVLEKLSCRTSGGEVRIVDQPPIATHVDHASREELSSLFEQYRTTLREDTRYLLSQYEVVDYVLRVVGVGSVGTRCYLLALRGPAGDTLFLQAKEAQRSVLVTHGGRRSALPGAPGAAVRNQGHRVVAAQRILQAQSDPFLGYIRGWAGDAEPRHRVDYYWRQFRDMKGGVDPAVLTGPQLTAYAGLCGRLLARAHAQSPGGAEIAGYLGRSDRFDRAVARWSAAYADVNEADYAALRKAASTGRVPVEYDA
ncbi:MAG: DUF2252 domain-containing protein [Thermoleophilia bacterium]